jgi:hypothetical protein
MNDFLDDLRTQMGEGPTPDRPGWLVPQRAAAGSLQAIAESGAETELARPARITLFAVAVGGLVVMAVNTGLTLSYLESAGSVGWIGSVITWPVAGLQPVLLALAAAVILVIAAGSGGFKRLSGTLARVAQIAQWSCVLLAVPTALAIVVMLLLIMLCVIVVVGLIWAVLSD